MEKISDRLYRVLQPPAPPRIWHVCEQYKERKSVPISPGRIELTRQDDGSYKCDFCGFSTEL